VDLNRLYFDHQLHLIQAQRAQSAESRQLYRQGASLLAGRIGCMQNALGADAAQGWARAASADNDGTGLPPRLPVGPMRIPHDWRGAAEGAGI